MRYHASPSRRDREKRMAAAAAEQKPKAYYYAGESVENLNRAASFTSSADSSSSDSSSAGGSGNGCFGALFAGLGGKKGGVEERPLVRGGPSLLHRADSQDTGSCSSQLCRNKVKPEKRIMRGTAP